MSTNNYWKRKRDEEAGTINVIGYIKEINFSYKGKNYIYKFVANTIPGFEYIYDGSNKISGPYQNECTELGNEIYKALRNQKII